MKTKDFERILLDAGFELQRNSKHRIWAKGVKHIAIPQGKTLNRMVARRLLKEIGYEGKVEEINYGK